jgi:hypothetical protein
MTNENQAATVDRIIARNTPTDDELHALGDVIEHVQTTWEADRDQYIEPLAEFTARGILAAGFRRTEVPRVIERHDLVMPIYEDEVPEPSAEHQEHADARRAETMALLSHSEPQGEPSDALVREIEERVYAEYQGIAGLAVALVRAGYEAGLNARSCHRKDT